MPIMFFYEPNKLFNVHKLITIEQSNYDPNTYQYTLEGPTLINVSKEAHSRFMKLAELFIEREEENYGSR